MTVSYTHLDVYKRQLMAQSMSDSQVLEYVKDGIRQGKEQKQLASELAIGILKNLSRIICTFAR